MEEGVPKGMTMMRRVSPPPSLSKHALLCFAVAVSQRSPAANEGSLSVSPFPLCVQASRSFVGGRLQAEAAAGRPAAAAGVRRCPARPRA